MLALIIAVAALMPLPLTLAQLPHPGAVWGDSADFTLDTRPNFRFGRFGDSLPQPGAVWGDSADFTLDTRPNFRFGRFADSPNFVLDTRGSVLVSGLSGLALEADRFGRRRGPLAGAAVEVAGAGSGWSLRRPAGRRRILLWKAARRWGAAARGRRR
jgi:hypothetical protein